MQTLMSRAWHISELPAIDIITRHAEARPAAEPNDVRYRRHGREPSNVTARTLLPFSRKHTADYFTFSAY